MPRGAIAGALVAVLIVSGLVALAAGKPNAGDAITAVASSTPTSTARNAPTPTAVIHAPWEWTPAVIPLASNASQVREVWALDAAFVALADDYTVDPGPGSALLVSADGADWDLAPLPPDALAIANGMLFDGELWLVGSTGKADAPGWHLWSTADGAAWVDRGTVNGLIPKDATLSDIAATRSGFVATVFMPPPDPDHPGTEQIRSSPDGRTWSRVAIPDLDENTQLAGLVADGDRWLIPANFGDESSGHSLRVLSATDPAQWDSTGVSSRGQGIGLVLAAGPSGYAIGGAEPDSASYRPVVWTSADAARWSQATLDIPPGRDGAAVIGALSTERGLLLLGNHGGDAWISSNDNAAWSYRNVSPSAQNGFFGAFAIRGDTVVAGGSADSGTANLWRGSLSLLGW